VGVGVGVGIHIGVGMGLELEVAVSVCVYDCPQKLNLMTECMTLFIRLRAKISSLTILSYFCLLFLFPLTLHMHACNA
jgi:hypothetical protein